MNNKTFFQKQGQPQRDQLSHDQPSTLPPFDFWENREKKLIKADLFSETAREIAKRFDVKDKNRPSQLRKFYDEVLRLKLNIKNQQDFEKQLPLIYMLNARVAYSYGKKSVDNTFKTFIEKALKQIKDLDDFNVFVTLFEAVMCFYKEIRPTEK